MNNVARLEPGALMSVAMPSPGVASLFRLYRRQLPVFFGTALAIFLVVAAFTLMRSPQYTAETNVIVVPRKAEVGSDRSSPLSDPTTDASVDTQVEVLRSRTLAGIVVDQLRLADPVRFQAFMGSPGLIDRFLPTLAGQEKPAPASLAKRRDAVIESLGKHLEVRRIAQTFALGLAYTSSDRQLSADIVNAFAAAYVRQSLDLKLDAARKASRLLASQLDQAQANVNAAQAAVGHYRIEHNLMSLGTSTVAEQEMTTFDQEVATARASEAEARARYQTARQQMAAGSNGEDVGEALGSPVVQELRRQRAEVSRHVAELSSRYGPRYPAIAVAKQQLADFDAQIQSEVGRLLSNLDAQSEVAARRTGSLQSSLDHARGALASTNVAAVRLGELQLKANAAQELYEELLTRVREIGTQAATTQPDARVAGLAVPPIKQSAPNIPINLLVGALLGIAGGISVVVLRQGFDQGLSTLDEVEARLNLPYLAGLPTVASSIANARGRDPITALIDNRESAYAEGFRSLAASVLQGSDKRSVRTIVLTSALPNEGKTTAAIGLARILAMSGRRVVLVDADLRRPRIARSLQIRPQSGLREVLDGEATLDEALVHDEASGAAVLAMLPGGKFKTSPIEDGRMDALIADLKTRFDLIIFDVSPVLPVVDGRLLAKKADAVVLLARWRRTPEPAVELAAHLLRGVGAATTGIALTRVDLHALARSGYGDPAQFLKLYSSYYA